jgi:hypothetical protein
LLRDAVTGVALPFISLAATLLIVVELELLEAAVLVTFIRSISALGFTVTHVGLSDTFTVGTGPFGGRVAATDFVVVEWIAFEAAFFHHLIRLVRALGFTVTHLSFESALTIKASHLGLRIAATDLGAIVVELFKAAFLVTFIYSVRALGFSVTTLGLEVALFMILVTREFSFRVAATSLVRVSFVLLEAALLVILVRFVSALSLTITKSLQRDTVTVGTLPLVFAAATSSVVVEWEFLEAALVISIIRTILAFS